MDIYFEYRFIPTCVGQMISTINLSLSFSGSSPHAWGRCCSSLIFASFSAVHPHMRGADALLPDVLAIRIRFIPTCVGQMPTTPPNANWASRFIPTCVGQMDVIALHLVRPGRFIPTCVGQMVCNVPLGLLQRGSSPHAWGRWRNSNTARRTAAVHPHMRGADGHSRRLLLPLCGSSPHAWGRYFPKQSYCLIFIS